MKHAATNRVIPVLHAIAAVGLALWLAGIVCWPWLVDNQLGTSTVSSIEKLCRQYFCHRMPSRSLAYSGHELLVCSRCTGVIAGYFLGAVAALCGAERLWFWRVPWAIVFIGLMGASWLAGQLGWLDGLEAWWRDLWHAERVVAGAFGGLGGYILIARCVVLLINWVQRQMLEDLEGATS